MKAGSRFANVVGILLLVMAAGCLGYFFINHAAPVAQFELVKPGMTKDQVEALLGAPHATRLGSNGESILIYGKRRPLMWCSMEVAFDAEGRVTGKFHDH